MNESFRTVSTSIVTIWIIANENPPLRHIYVKQFVSSRISNRWFRDKQTKPDLLRVGICPRALELQTIIVSIFNIKCAFKPLRGL